MRPTPKYGAGTGTGAGAAKKMLMGRACWLACSYYRVRGVVIVLYFLWFISCLSNDRVCYILNVLSHFGFPADPYLTESHTTLSSNCGLPLVHP